MYIIIATYLHLNTISLGLHAFDDVNKKKVLIQSPNHNTSSTYVYVNASYTYLCFATEIGDMQVNLNTLLWVDLGVDFNAIVTIPAELVGVRFDVITPKAGFPQV